MPDAATFAEILALFVQFVIEIVLFPTFILPTIPLIASVPFNEPFTVTFSTVRLPLEYPTNPPTESAFAFGYLEPSKSTLVNLMLRIVAFSTKANKP